MCRATDANPEPPLPETPLPETPLPETPLPEAPLPPAQGMSYANLAGLPYVYGLYGAFVPNLVYAVFGYNNF